MDDKPERTRISIEVDADLKKWLEEAAQLLPHEPGRRGRSGKLSRYCREVLRKHREDQEVSLKDIADESARLGRWISQLPEELRPYVGLIAEALAAHAQGRPVEDVLADAAKRMSGDRG